MKINNTQRAGMVRQLQELKSKLQSSGTSYCSYNRYGYSGDDNAEVKAVVAELEKKHRVAFLKEEQDKAEKATDLAIEAVDKGLDRFNDEKKAEHEKTLKDLALAIRDIWAAETVEDAKAIVEQFVK